MVSPLLDKRVVGGGVLLMINRSFTRLSKHYRNVLNKVEAHRCPKRNRKLLSGRLLMVALAMRAKHRFLLGGLIRHCDHVRFLPTGSRGLLDIQHILPAISFLLTIGNWFGGGGCHANAANRMKCGATWSNTPPQNAGTI